MPFIKIHTEYELLSPPDFAREHLTYLKNNDSGRKEVYRLIKNDKIDHTIIGGNKLVVLTKRTENWIRNNKR